MELPRDAGMHGNSGRRVISWPFLAEKDRLRPGGSVTRKWPESGTFQRQNPAPFLAMHGKRQKMVPAEPGLARSLNAFQRSWLVDYF
jgi:hypothetical protein